MLRSLTKNDNVTIFTRNHPIKMIQVRFRIKWCSSSENAIMFLVLILFMYYYFFVKCNRLDVIFYSKTVTRFSERIRMVKAM